MYGTLRIIFGVWDMLGLDGLRIGYEAWDVTKLTWLSSFMILKDWWYILVCIRLSIKSDIGSR